MLVGVLLWQVYFLTQSFICDVGLVDADKSGNYPSYSS